MFRGLGFRFLRGLGFRVKAFKEPLRSPRRDGFEAEDVGFGGI